MRSYNETIERLKKEMESHVARLKSNDELAQVEKIYRALRTIEELAGVPRTTLEELFGFVETSAQAAAAKHAAKISELALGDQQESEAAAEIEKGA